MRMSLFGTVLTITAVVPAAAQQAHAEPPKLLTANGGLMFWTFVIFVVVLIVLTKFAFKPITRAVEARERALEEAIEFAKRDREEAARLLEDHRRLIDEAHTEAQHVIAEGRASGEKVRADVIERAHREQQLVLERARQEIQNERDQAIVELRREAVNLAIRAAGRVIEKNLDDETNRQLVESFLASIEPVGSER